MKALPLHEMLATSWRFSAVSRAQHDLTLARVPRRQADWLMGAGAWGTLLVIPLAGRPFSGTDTGTRA